MMQPMIETLAQYLELPPTELEWLLKLGLTDFLNSHQLKQKLGNLDVALLQQTLPTAKTVLAEQLPTFYDWLHNELKVQRIPDSPDHATRWVVGFLNHQESLSHLVELHHSVPRPALESSIPRMLAMFEGVEEAQTRQEWQQALATLCLVLVIGAREVERSS